MTITELLAIADIASEDFGAAPLARRGETFKAPDDEAAALVHAGVAVRADSAEAALHRDARAALVGKRDG